MSQKLLLIDGNSIVNRAYFAMPMLSDMQGNNINAVYGFVNILLKVVEQLKPDKLVVAFDKRGANFRKQIYPDYKANRKGMPEDLASQMPILHDLLATMQVTVVEKAGVEADDIIGTISSHFDGESYVVSGDRDMLQLVSDKVTVLITKKGVTDVEVVTPHNIKELYGMTASQVVDYKALRGDTSDNIPGVKGVGEKTALQLLERHGDLDTLFANLDKEKGALKEKLANGKDLAYVSKKLAQIVLSADVDYDLEKCGLYVLNGEVKQLFQKMQFKSIINRVHFDESQVVANHLAEVVEVDSQQQLEQLVESWKTAPRVALNYTKTHIEIAVEPTRQYHVLFSDNFLVGMTEDVVFSVLSPILQGDTPKIVFDQKGLKRLFDGFGITLSNVQHDLCLMQYLVEPRAHKDVASLASAYGYEQNAVALLELVDVLRKQMVEKGVEKLYYEIEFPLSEVLYQMEKEGVAVDLDVMQSLSKDLQAQIDQLSQQIYQLAGCTFNLNSTVQLADVLFNKLGLPHGKKTQRGYSTDNEVLEKLRSEHPIADQLLAYRKLYKLLHTYVEGIKPFVKRGVVHTVFNQALTTTGRLSSSDPNMQNIPIRSDTGRDIRKIFKAKHGVFVGADYSQIELRLLAAFSGDENLLFAFNNGQDIHTSVASELLGIPPQMVNKDMRRMAKAVNFGIIYGISDFGLSQSANISIKKAKEYIQLYFQRYPKIKAYIDGCVEQAKTNGYVTTITGRRRYIPEISSGNYNLRAFGERAAMNMPLQGSAADIMKIAMLKVHNAMQQQGLQSKLVLQIHDELIVDCYLDEVEQVKRILVEQMQSAMQLACPLTVELEQGETLYEA